MHPRAPSSALTCIVALPIPKAVRAQGADHVLGIDYGLDVTVLWVLGLQALVVALQHTLFGSAG